MTRATRWVLGVVTLVGATILATSARAGLVEKIPSLWLVREGDDTGREVEVAPDGVVTLTTLLPVAAAELANEAIRAADGSIIAPAGEQLYARAARGGVAYCAMTGRKVMGPKSVGPLSSAATDPCFMDSDGNGEFDHSFRIDTWNASLFGMAFVSKKNVEIKPVAYRSLEPAKFQGRYTVGIKYVGTNRISSREQFSIAFGGETLATPVCCVVLATGEGYPRHVEIMGSKLDILNNDKGKIHVKVNVPLQTGPFSLRGNI